MDSLGDGVVNFSLKNAGIGTSVRHSMEHCKGQEMLYNDECLTPPGFDGVKIDNVEPPLGFESCGNFKPSKKVPSRQQQTMERRVTRSQKKLEKNGSQGTSESMIKLAKELIEVGKLFGVAVINKEEVVIRNIIDSLKKRKKEKAL